MYRRTDDSGAVEAIGPRNIAAASHDAMTTQNRFTNQSSFAEFPVSADATALTVDFTKVLAGSRLLVNMAATAQLTSGDAQSLYLGLRFGSTDHQVARRFFDAGISRASVGAVAVLVGVPKGEYSVTVVFRSGPSAEVDFYHDDFVSFSIEEIT